MNNSRATEQGDILKHLHAGVSGLANLPNFGTKQTALDAQNHPVVAKKASSLSQGVVQRSNGF